jgi:hypothetical protein
MIKISDLVAMAEKAGFKVHESRTHALLWFPENVNKPAAVHINGSLYCNADIVLSSLPECDYTAPYGPFHDGYISETNYGVQKLYRFLVFHNTSRQDA